MSIVTFYNSSREQTGKTMSIAAIATYMAIEHNYRILVISSSWNDSTLENCFWEPRKKVKKNLGLFGPNTSIAMEDGIEGLVKLIRSNRVTPNNITNYTKIVFKDRLEILTGFKATKSQYDEESILYPDIINLANSFYDIVLVDLATVPDLFLRLRQSKDDERNGPFITEIGKTVENIVYRLQNSQMK